MFANLASFAVVIAHVILILPLNVLSLAVRVVGALGVVACIATSCSIANRLVLGGDITYTLSSYSSATTPTVQFSCMDKL